MLELYHADGSVCAQKVRFALAEKGIEWVDRRMDLDTGAQYEPTYLQLNPKAVVPTLVHDGHVVTESTVICEYLDDVFPEPSLRPNDPHQCAVMRKWAKVPDDEIHAACGVISQAGLFRKARLANPKPYYERLAKDPNRKRADRNKRMLERGFDDAEARAALFVHVRLIETMQAALDGQEWLVGNHLTLADVGLAPYINRLYVSGLAAMWHDKPAVAQWFARIRALPSFEEAFAKFTPRYGNDPRPETDVWPEVEKALAKGDIYD